MGYKQGSSLATGIITKTPQPPLKYALTINDVKLIRQPTFYSTGTAPLGPSQAVAAKTQDDMTSNSEGPYRNEPMEKNETEKQLEKRVFGDDLGFHEGLKFFNNDKTVLQGLVDGDRVQAQDGLEDENLEGLDDADVCKLVLPVGFT